MSRTSGSWTSYDSAEDSLTAKGNLVDCCLVSSRVQPSLPASNGEHRRPDLLLAPSNFSVQISPFQILSLDQGDKCHHLSERSRESRLLTPMATSLVWFRRLGLIYSTPPWRQGFCRFLVSPERPCRLDLPGLGRLAEAGQRGPPRPAPVIRLHAPTTAKRPVQLGRAIVGSAGQMWQTRGRNRSRNCKAAKSIET